MHEQNLIDGRLFEWSDLMRAVGNEAAHGVGLSIQQPDAKDILEFTNYYGLPVFVQGPFRGVQKAPVISTRPLGQASISFEAVSAGSTLS
jgi:hypothetical protein